jgi:hypothetical protein
MSKSRKEPFGQLEFFGSTIHSRAADVLDAQSWPDLKEFPTNRSRHHVRDVVWEDLVSSKFPLLVAGYSSLGELVQLISHWDLQGHEGGQVRMVFGAEPFMTNRHSFRSDRKEFTTEVLHYWEERGISLRLSAQVLQTIEALKTGVLQSRFTHGRQRLHAKIYVGDQAATLGSSNLTTFGLEQQFEANARFERTGEKRRYSDTVLVAENYWRAGEPFDEELLTLLEELLQVVSWQEALARACAELLEGSWAERYLHRIAEDQQPLWPSQRSGIAEALWITENVGSVLVADATGSGKTRMGAHLVRAVRDRLWSKGLVRRDLTALVGPPAVIDTWEQEAIRIGLMLSKVSHGLLSRTTSDGSGREEALVRTAQILAVDEAHNFLNVGSKRTRQVRESLADNILLFTATPISRGASDLLNLVGLLGPDNFDEATLEVLSRLERRRGLGAVLSAEEVEAVRREIQRFTVRRTKTQINEMVDRDPESYRHPASGRICRYPNHEARIYQTGETKTDADIARQIRVEVDQLNGIAQLEPRLTVPLALRSVYSDEEWLKLRLRSVKGLARHHVLEALRSSRAALFEHVHGTAEAARRFSLNPRFKPLDTGDTLTKLDGRSIAGPPEVELACVIPDWLVDSEEWKIACGAERARYAHISELVEGVSSARENAKVARLTELCRHHDLVLAFDRHPITLSVLESLLGKEALGDTEVLVATSGKKAERKRVIARFAPGSESKAIALCSDAMNEGLNLQGASCIVHLDLPTTLRVAEQRVGRVDRMTSSHDTIEAWWPQDGEAFATRAYEKLVSRAHESEQYLGSNLKLPTFNEAEMVSVEAQIKEVERQAPDPWDGIQDALEPVRQLIYGPGALITPAIYEAYRDATSRVLARVSPLRSTRSWAFFAVAAVAHGAPRWMIVDPSGPAECITDMREVAGRLHTLLADDPPGSELDVVAIHALDRLLDAASRFERQLLPRRMRRALDQMSLVVGEWANQARRVGDEVGAAEWTALERLAFDAEVTVDPYLVAEQWLRLIAPEFERYRQEHRRARYVLLKDIQRALVTRPLPYESVVEAFVGLPAGTPFADRVSVCILGVPES